VDLERREEVTVLSLAGAVDSSTLSVFKDSLHPISPVRRSNTVNMVIDLSGLRYINSRAVEILSMYHRRCYVDRGSLALCGASDTLMKNLKTFGLGSMLRLYPTREDALRGVADEGAVSACA